ncbi:hypothetical protein NDU88_003077 [Pleurodeles waltl]|uniref:Uncharacterized protein n=1 Tax=Pleurodeles waltl TaxID=8319 RepID=A0AAV7SDT9_PLEWA|nr:hypothetical protein NDU88_003077 [Pleurodeles waltl]
MHLSLRQYGSLPFSRGLAVPGLERISLVRVSCVPSSVPSGAAAPGPGGRSSSFSHLLFPGRSASRIGPPVWPRRGAVAAGRLFLPGYPAPRPSSRARPAIGGDPEGPKPGTRFWPFRQPPLSRPPRGPVLGRCLRGCDAAPPPQTALPFWAALSCGPGLKHGPRSRNVGSPLRAALFLPAATFHGPNLRCVLRGRSAAPPPQGVGGSLAAHSSLQIPQALVRPAREQRTLLFPPPQLRRISRMRRGALKARVRHV